MCFDLIFFGRGKFGWGIDSLEVMVERKMVRFKDFILLLYGRRIIVGIDLCVRVKNIKWFYREIWFLK